MKAEKVSYERLESRQDYSHTKVGVTLIVEEGEDPQWVLAQAKKIVDRHLNQERLAYEKRWEKQPDDLPF